MIFCRLCKRKFFWGDGNGACQDGRMWWGAFVSILAFVELCSSRPLVVNIQPEIKRKTLDWSLRLILARFDWQKFETSNYRIRTCPSREWKAIVDGAKLESHEMRYSKHARGHSTSPFEFDIAFWILNVLSLYCLEVSWLLRCGWNVLLHQGVQAGQCKIVCMIKREQVWSPNTKDCRPDAATTSVQRQPAKGGGDRSSALHRADGELPLAQNRAPTISEIVKGNCILKRPFLKIQKKLQSALKPRTCPELYIDINTGTSIAYYNSKIWVQSLAFEIWIKHCF